MKPTNCIVNDQRGLVLIDVSTLRLVNDGADALGLHTPEYTAPEVLRAPRSPRTAAADVYALGALTTFCLLGEDPPPAGALEGARRVAEKLRAIGRAAAVTDPEALTAHIMATLDPDPERRPADLVAWSRRLLELASEPSPLPGRESGQRLRAITPRPRTRNTVTTPHARSRRSLMLLGAVCLLAVLLVGALTIRLWPLRHIPDSGHGAGSSSFGSYPSSAVSGDAPAPMPSAHFQAPATAALHRHLAVAAQDSGEVDVFWTSVDGSLEHRYLVNDRWLGPEKLGSGLAGSDPAVTTSAPGVLDVFWVGTDRDLWHMRSDHGAWSEREDMGGGPLSGPPTTTGQPNGVVDVFWRSSNAALWHKRLTGTGWGPIEPLNGGGLASDPVATVQPSGTIDVFWEATDGAVGHQYLVNGAWSSPQPLGSGAVGGPPAAVAQSTGTVDVFWKRADSQLGHEYYTAGWYGPQAMGGSLGSEPYPVSATPGTVDVFWKGADAALWHVYYAGGAWHGPVNVGAGLLGGAPVATAQPNGVIDVFWKSTTGHLFHKRYNGRWANTDDLGSTIF